MHVLIVDDHQLIRSAISSLLDNEFINVLCVEADCGTSALIAISKHQFDCAIVDLFLPGEPPFEFIRMLCEQRPELPVIVLSATSINSHKHQCMEIGASAFINKGEAMETVSDVLSTLLPKEILIPRVMGRFSLTAEQLPDIALDEVINKLTERQLDILGLLAQGKSNKEVARERNLSDNTVKVHVSAILRALNLNNRTQLGLLAHKIGINRNSY